MSMELLKLAKQHHIEMRGRMMHAHNMAVQVWQAILVKKVDLDAPHLKGSMSDGARDLLRGLLRRDPTQRMTALEALDHPWVKEGGAAADLPLGGSVVSHPLDASLGILQRSQMRRYTWLLVARARGNASEEVAIVLLSLPLLASCSPFSVLRCNCHPCSYICAGAKAAAICHIRPLETAGAAYDCR